MEETNYDRKHAVVMPSETQLSATPEKQSEGGDSKGHSESDVKQSGTGESPPQGDMEPGQALWSRKTYLQKLSLKDKPRPNRLIDVAIAPFKGFTYPAVVYAGYVT